MPIGMYPFRDQNVADAHAGFASFPLPIGMYPFRDMKNIKNHWLRLKVPIAYRHVSLSRPIPLHFEQNASVSVPIAYRHVSLSRHDHEYTRACYKFGSHCLSACIPFETLLIISLRLRLIGSHCLSACIPFETNPDVTLEKELNESPLPIGMYPFRDTYSQSSQWA